MPVTRTRAPPACPGRYRGPPPTRASPRASPLRRRAVRQRAEEGAVVGSRAPPSPGKMAVGEGRSQARYSGRRLEPHTGPVPREDCRRGICTPSPLQSPGSAPPSRLLQARRTRPPPPAPRSAAGETGRGVGAGGWEAPAGRAGGGRPWIRPTAEETRPGEKKWPAWWMGGWGVF
jgi:hypothetical protein